MERNIIEYEQISGRWKTVGLPTGKERRVLFRRARRIIFFFLASALTVSTGLAFDHRQLPGLGRDISEYEARLHLARLLSHSGDRVDEAILQYRTLREMHPEDPAVLSELAEALIRGKYFQAAVAELESVGHGQPGSGDKRGILLSRAYAGMGEDAAVLRLLDPLHRADPGNREIGLELARACIRLGKTESAQIILGRLHERFPEDTELMVEMADAEAAAGHASACRRYFSKALQLAGNPAALRLAYASRMNMWGDFYGVESIYRDHLSRHPEDTAVRHKLAEVLVSAQRYEEAESIYKLLLVDGHRRLAVLLATARLHFEAKNDPMAIGLINKILDPEPEPESVRLDRSLENGRMHLRISLPQRIDSIKTFLLEAPRRLILDLYGSGLGSDTASYPVGHAGIRQIRIGSHPGRIRVVADAATQGFTMPLVVYGGHTVHMVFGAGTDSGDDPDTAASSENMAEIYRSAFRLKARVLLRMGRTEPAIYIHRFRSLSPGERTDAFLSLGRLYLKRGERAEAAAWFTRAHHLDSESIAVRFYHAGPDTAATQAFLDRLTASAEITPMRLMEWGRLYAENGLFKQAIVCYRAAATADPACFPARMALAETLAFDRRYDESIEAFEALAAEFPANRKIWVSWARVLSWARAYDAALAVYADVHRENPQDPLPVMEMARTAEWGKRMDRAMESYALLWKNPVDRRLAETLDRTDVNHAPAFLKPVIQRTRQLAEAEGIYRGYEHFISALAKIGDSAPQSIRSEMDRIAAGLWGIYRIQKTARLESRAKQLAWEGRFPAALSVYDALIETRPGNQEALFSAGQVQCALGLCDREADTYGRLLELEPHHTLAANALKRQQIRSRGSAVLGYGFWKERGRDELARISRHHYELVADLPVTCRYRLTVKGHRWHEYGHSGDDDYRAIGHTIGFNGIIGPRVGAALHWTRKDYSDKRLGNTDTGSASLMYRLENGAEITTGYDRVDELFNGYGIEQGIQSSAWQAAIRAPLTRRWDIKGHGQTKRYNDGNTGDRVGAAVGYRVTDHPRLVKISISGDYRDTRKQNVYRFDNGRIVDITHPYWTPDDHLSTAVTFEWHHDLSENFFCGAQQHDYNLRLTLGTESESNESLQLEGEWRYEFRDRWSVNLKGLVHRSGEWDAEGLWTEIRYRF